MTTLSKPFTYIGRTKWWWWQMATNQHCRPSINQLWLPEDDQVTSHLRGSVTDKRFPCLIDLTENFYQIVDQTKENLGPIFMVSHADGMSTIILHAMLIRCTRSKPIRVVQNYFYRRNAGPPRTTDSRNKNFF